MGKWWTKKGQKLDQHVTWKCLFLPLPDFLSRKIKIWGLPPYPFHGPNPLSSIWPFSLQISWRYSMSQFSVAVRLKKPVICIWTNGNSQAHIREQNMLRSWSVEHCTLNCKLDAFVCFLVNWNWWVCLQIICLWKWRDVSLTVLRLWILNTNKLAASVVVEIFTGQHY